MYLMADFTVDVSFFIAPVLNTLSVSILHKNEQTWDESDKRQQKINRTKDMIGIITCP